MNKRVRDWVCYDAECALCVRWANRLRSLLEGNGFTLLPLQSPTVRGTLKIPRDELLAEMRVITNDGRVFGGADALLYITRVICRPIFELTRIPGARPLLRTVYRFIARNRTCSANACTLRHDHEFGTSFLPLLTKRGEGRIGKFTALKGKRHFATLVGNPVDWLPLVLLPPAVAAIGSLLPGWLDMWLIAFALFAGCKWLCYRRGFAKAPRVHWTRKVGFLVGWIGMDTTPFTEKKPAAIPRPVEWIFAVSKVFLGTTLIWLGARHVLTINWLLGGWAGMVGIILTLHFGFFHLLALAWRTTGVPVTPLMRAPLLSRSVSEFWAERWNTAFNRLATRLLFRPFRHVFGLPAATMLVFFVSGLIHDLVISVPARGGYGLPTLYFLLQGAAVLFERTNLARRCGFKGGLPSRLFTIATTAGPAFWLFHPTFVRNVILPFLKAIRAT